MPRMDRTIKMGQRWAEQLMLDTVRVTRPPDPDAPPKHDEWGNIVEPEPVTVYQGKAKFQHSDPYPSSPDAGEARWVTGVRQLHLPYGTASVRAGDIAECIESQNVRLLGLKVRLRIDGDKTLTSAVRFNAEEVIGSGG